MYVLINFIIGIVRGAIIISSQAYAKMPDSKPNVVFVLGRPGAGKGTQCGRIVDKFKFCHLSAGELLRQERGRPGSKYSEVIENCFQQMKIIPVEITCKLLENAMIANGGNKFLIDAFPINQENLDGWHRTMSDKVNVLFVLFFDCPEEKCRERCLGRGAAGSGRYDDNEECLRKRFATYLSETMPIVDYYAAKDQVKKIDASRGPDEVFQDVSIIFEAIL